MQVGALRERGDIAAAVDEFRRALKMERAFGTAPMSARCLPSLTSAAVSEVAV